MVLTKGFEINDVDSGEILRYMRAGGATDDALISLVDKVKHRMLGLADCRSCYIKLPIQFMSDESILLGGIVLGSKRLCALLDGCTEAYVFCATAGVAVDREIQRAEKISPLRSLASDAAGSAIVEAACDLMQEYFLDTEAQDGREITNRFSPGYGGLSLDCQRDIVNLLETKKHVGVSLTDGLMLAPCKSVTAIVGVIERGRGL